RVRLAFPGPSASLKMNPTGKHTSDSVHAMASATASEHPGRKPFLLESRVEFRSIRTDRSARNPVPAAQDGKKNTGRAYTSHIRTQKCRQGGEPILALPNHPLRTGGLGRTAV